MQFKIKPIKAKITDEVDSDTINVSINNDTGESCTFFYNVGYISIESPLHQSPLQRASVFKPTLQNTSFQIKGNEYDAFSQANTSNAAKFKFVADYVCSKFPVLILE